MSGLSCGLAEVLNGVDQKWKDLAVRIMPPVQPGFTAARENLAGKIFLKLKQMEQHRAIGHSYRRSP